MNRTEFIKELIDKTGLNLKAFSRRAGVPYTTLRSMLDRRIENASVNTVLKVCSALNISIEDLYNTSSSKYLKPDEIDLLENYNSLNNTGKREVLKRIAEINLIPKYTEKFESITDPKTNETCYIDNTDHDTPHDFEKHSGMTANNNYDNFHKHSGMAANNNYDNFDKHSGMAAHNDYAEDSDELLLIQKDLDEL